MINRSLPQDDLQVLSTEPGGAAGGRVKAGRINLQALACGAIISRVG